jgi:hypothetical protein
MEIKLEQNIPLPATRKQNKYPLNTMEIGASFSMPKEYRNSLNASIAHMRKRHGKKYRLAVDPKDPDRVRVWRIE